MISGPAMPPHLRSYPAEAFDQAAGRRGGNSTTATEDPGNRPACLAGLHLDRNRPADRAIASHLQTGGAPARIAFRPEDPVPKPLPVERDTLPDRDIARQMQPTPAEAFEAHPYQPTNIDAYRSVAKRTESPARPELSTFGIRSHQGAGLLRQILRF